MFNLLPQKDKENILKEYAARRTVILLCFVSFLGIVSSISLLPTYLISSAKVAETKNQIKNVKASPVFQEAENFSLELANAKTKISILNADAEKVSFTNIIKEILLHKGSSIRVDAFSFKRAGEKENSSMTIQGIARDRESLSIFLKNLESEELFKEVVLPVSNFAKDKNAEFSIEIKGAF